MPKCPNCGLDTLRTLDWACEWCGYPLLSGNYKKIEKTYKQLLEERQLAELDKPGSVVEEIEAIRELKKPPAEKPPLTIEPPKRRKPPAIPVKPAFEIPEQINRSESETDSEVTPESGIGKTIREARSNFEPPVEPETTAKPGLMREANLIPEMKLSVSPEADAEPEVTPVKETIPEPDPESEAPVDVAALLGKTSLTADEIDSLYRVDETSADGKFAGKTLTLSGVVERVFVNDNLGIHYLIVTGNRKNAVWNTRCTFNTDFISEIKKLTPGQALTVQGRYGGHGKNIILKECILVR